MPLQTSRKSEKIPPFIPFIMVIKGFRDQLILLFSFSQICDTSHERMGCMRTGSTSGLRAVGSTPPPKTQSSTSFAIVILTSLTGGVLLKTQACKALTRSSLAELVEPLSPKTTSCSSITHPPHFYYCSHPSYPSYSLLLLLLLLLFRIESLIAIKRNILYFYYSKVSTNVPGYINDLLTLRSV